MILGDLTYDFLKLGVGDTPMLYKRPFGAKDQLVIIRIAINYVFHTDIEPPLESRQTVIGKSDHFYFESIFS